MAAVAVASSGFGVLVGPPTVMETSSTAPNCAPAPSVMRQEDLYVPELLGACIPIDKVVHLPGTILLLNLTDVVSPNLSPLANS